MSKQVKKVCKHEPGKDWTDGCCSSNQGDNTSSTKSDEQVRKFAFEQSYSDQAGT